MYSQAVTLYVYVGLIGTISTVYLDIMHLNETPIANYYSSLIYQPEVVMNLVSTLYDLHKKHLNEIKIGLSFLILQLCVLITHLYPNPMIY